MSNIINQALGRLHESLDYLDLAVEEQAKRISKTKQHDLFNGRAGGVAAIDTSLVAKKLDAAIAKVEMMLKEG